MKEGMKMNLSEVTINELQEFFEFLQGDISSNEARKITFISPPKVSKETAISIIYYLQEVMGIVPDTYESCKKCSDFYDSGNEGCLAMYCEGCGCQHSEFLDQNDGCIKCQEALYEGREECHTPQIENQNIEGSV